MVVNRTKDFIERTGWTALQVGGGALLAYIQTGQAWSWRTAAYAVGLAVLKVLVAQNVGTRGSGDAIPGGVIEAPK